MREFEIKQARIAIEILGSFKDPRIRFEEETTERENAEGLPISNDGF